MVFQLTQPNLSISISMSLKALAAKILAKRIHAKTQKWVNNPIETQQKVFQELIKKGIKN